MAASPTLLEYLHSKGFPFTTRHSPELNLLLARCYLSRVKFMPYCSIQIESVFRFVYGV